MKKLFVNNVIFRWVGPFFVGLVIYLLILLLQNTISSLGEIFASQELYLCVAIAYFNFEYARFCVLFLKPKKSNWPLFIVPSLQIIATFIGLLAVIYLAVTFYYRLELGYDPSLVELSVFFHLYGFATILYLTIHFSHFFLFEENKVKMEEAQHQAKHIAFEFRNFKKDMNPELLMESLESLISIIERDIGTADELIDELSVVYRYILGNRSSELVPVKKELDVVQHLINLFWYQGKDIDFKYEVGDVLCVPGTFLTAVEWLIRSSIHSSMRSFSISIFQSSEDIRIESNRKSKLNPSSVDFSDLNTSYAFYTHRRIEVKETNGVTAMEVPFLLQAEPLAV